MAGRQDNTLSSELADYIQYVTYQDISAKVVRRAKEAVIDGIGVMLAGYSTDCGTLIRRYIGGLGVSGNCTAVGDASALPAEYAALVNGVNGHAHDYDDTRFPRCRTGFMAC
jgi:2-methylcitrate dehydratase PrpD